MKQLPSKQNEERHKGLKKYKIQKVSLEKLLAATAPASSLPEGEQMEIWEEVARNHTGGINESGLKHLLEHFVITRKQ